MTPPPKRCVSLCTAIYNVRRGPVSRSLVLDPHRERHNVSVILFSDQESRQTRFSAYDSLTFNQSRFSQQTLSPGSLPSDILGIKKQLLYSSILSYYIALLLAYKSFYYLIKYRQKYESFFLYCKDQNFNNKHSNIFNYHIFGLNILEYYYRNHAVQCTLYSVFFNIQWGKRYIESS